MAEAGANRKSAIRTDDSVAGTAVWLVSALTITPTARMSIRTPRPISIPPDTLSGTASEGLIMDETGGTDLEFINQPIDEPGSRGELDEMTARRIAILEKWLGNIEAYRSRRDLH